MMLDDHDWFDDLTSWDEVWPLLADDWVYIHDEQQRLRLENEFDHLVVREVDRTLRARQRRALHRMGFRPITRAHVTVWRWDVEAAVRRVDLEDFRTSFERVFDAWPAEARPAKVEQVRLRRARTHLVTAQAQRVVRDVFRSQPQDLRVAIYREPDYQDELDDKSLLGG